MLLTRPNVKNTTSSTTEKKELLKSSSSKNTGTKLNNSVVECAIKPKRIVLPIQVRNNATPAGKIIVHNIYKG